MELSFTMGLENELDEATCNLYPVAPAEELHIRVKESGWSDDALGGERGAGAEGGTMPEEVVVKLHVEDQELWPPVFAALTCQ